MKKNGTFIISLDFEMMWGAIFNESVEKGYRYRVPYVKFIVPRLLELFEMYDIHATWAVVGGIACEGKTEAVRRASDLIDDPYGNIKLKEFISQIPSQLEEQYFRPDLVKLISEYPNQEIATHTYSHFYYYEHDDALNKIEQEIISSKECIQEKVSEEICSIILPKNQVSNEIFPVMKKYGLKCIRGRQVAKRFNGDSFFERCLNFLDAYLPICGRKDYNKIEIVNDGIINLRASRFWRTYCKKLFMFEGLKMHRIRSEMKKAAKSGNIYHLWFHPHNLSSDYEKNLKSLEKILRYYRKLNVRYGMNSKNMGEFITDDM